MTTRIHPKATAGERETRAMRGLRLFRERGDEIVVYPTTGEYGVPSRTEEGVFYHVDLVAETCECPDSSKGKRTCLHLVAAEAKRREAARKIAPEPRPQRRNSAPPRAVRVQMARTFLKRMGGA